MEKVILACYNRQSCRSLMAWATRYATRGAIFPRPLSASLPAVRRSLSDELPGYFLRHRVFCD